MLNQAENSLTVTNDTNKVQFPVIENNQNSTTQLQSPINTISNGESVDTSANLKENVKYNPPKTASYQAVQLFRNLQTKDSTEYIATADKPSIFYTQQVASSISAIPRNITGLSEKGWVFGIAVISVLLLAVIRVYFFKHLSSIITSSVNFQFADKLMREKNVLIRRVFTLLNINFVISASLYIYVTLKHASIRLEGIGEFQMYLLVLGFLIVLLLIRLFVLYLLGNIFDAVGLFRDYIHNIYLLNKNLGLVLLPLILSVFYLTPTLADIVYYSATILVFTILLYRYIRSIQIIGKHKARALYTILYVISIEVIPVLVGIKYVLTYSV